MAKIDALSEKFRVLIEAVKDKPEAVKFFQDKQATLLEVLRLYNCRKAIITAAHAEFRTWARDLFDKNEKDDILEKFKIIDAKIEEQPKKRKQPKGRGQR